MTKTERQTVIECIEACAIQFNALTSCEGSQYDIEQVAEGIAITEQKLRSLLGTGSSGLVTF